jgi:glycosyltransferase involved in cell wall biosynthesis
VHDAVDGDVGDYLEAAGSGFHPVAISESQRRSRRLPWAGTIHNGIDTRGLGVSEPHDGPVVWLARFNPDKGPDLAIRACRAAGLPLVLAGKCQEPSEVRYLREEVRPMLGDDVRLLVNSDRQTTQQLLRRARCLVMPIRWREPFGMVMIEAMASGTPVVALRRGSVPEIVRDGVTGFVCDDAEALTLGLRQATQLNPEDCVADVKARFSASLMARRYEEVYRQVIARARRTQVVATVPWTPSWSAPPQLHR